MSITPLMPVYPRCGVRPVRGEHCHLIDEGDRLEFDLEVDRRGKYSAVNLVPVQS